MPTRLKRFTTALLYQTTVALGILLLPVALIARRLGVSLPVRRAIESAERLYRAAGA
ncbi:MAG: hypothetical protein ABEJ42_10255 [Halobacteriaceae archaeon]